MTEQSTRSLFLNDLQIWLIGLIGLIWECGGYKSLLIYRTSVTISDFTAIFCERFLSDLKFRRTVEQMQKQVFDFVWAKAEKMKIIGENGEAKLHE